MVQFILKPGDKNTACYPSTETGFVDHRQRFHVYVLETLGL
jgi:hypothetical protein